METIISYIDNLFRNYPDTPEVKKAREELLGIMEDKYNELKAEGKSENEAIGVVISEFGNIDEIAAELGIHKSEKEYSFEKDSREEQKLSFEQAKNYLTVNEDFGLKIGLGVALCILSPVVSCIVDPLAEAGYLPVKLADMTGAIALFLMVAVAVGIFITSGISFGKYEDIKKKKVVLDYGTRQAVTKQYEKFHQLFGTRIAVGVILCILSIVPSIVCDTFFGGTEYEWLVEMSAVCLFAFVAAAVFLFIVSGTRHGAYEVLLGKGEYAPEKANRKENKLTGIIAAIYWPVVTVIYLGWSFVTFNWGFTWIIWPLAGILFGGISAVISLVSENKNM